ncbi:MAG: nickel pincer cofactor biosynthesis protein LarB, partial [Persicimonas sp.]
MTTNIRQLLAQFKEGEVDEDEVIQRMVRQPFEEHLLGRFDHHREERTGIPEAILAEGKEPEEVRDIFERYLERDDQLIATRVTDEIVEALSELMPELHYHPDARIVATNEAMAVEDRHTVLVISAGSLDRSVAQEAAVTAELLGNPVERLYDVGVAGLTRFAVDLDRFDRAGIVIVCAGMDGALPSVVGGLAVQPVIAVPTSVGYGASFEGIAPLLTMLNSCSPGTAVMNIDNGFGAAVLATKMNQLACK